ncbi:hypothetical protein [Devosia riboflavina]
MAQYRVNNGSSLDKAFKVYGGHHIVSAGKEDDVLNAADLTEAQIDAFARDGVKVTKVEDKPKDDKRAIEPKTAKEALALFSAEGVHVNTAKAVAAKFLGDKVPADASKDVIVAKLDELAKLEN